MFPATISSGTKQKIMLNTIKKGKENQCKNPSMKFNWSNSKFVKFHEP